MNPAEPARAHHTKKRTRIQEANEQRILDAALEVFSSYGLRGSTIDQIAAGAGMTKPNLLYYFRRKDDIYLSVLKRTLEAWLQPLEALGAGDDPRGELRVYIDRKLEMSRDNPKASRLYAMEMLQGAPVLGLILGTRLKSLVDEKAALMQRWIAEGRMAPVDPYHLIFMVWATTQHYADFEVQIRSVLGDKATDDRHFEAATRALEDVILGGIFRR
ncbi:TetR family transcriptional regulator C-terminal domain-containing protein [Kaistia soli]|nr:TetR family transcriptional regulator C-terminal domain-containing protein [Kaistia soli]